MGSRSPLRPQGLVLLLFAGGAALLALSGVLFRDPYPIVPIVIAGALALVLGVRGFMLYAQPLEWPAGAPEGILNRRREIASLLQELPGDITHLGTYRFPKGFWELVVLTIAPRFLSITPANRPLLGLVGWGIAQAIVCVVVGIVLMTEELTTAGTFLLIGSLLLVGIRVFALYQMFPNSDPGSPKVISSQDDTIHLLEAGNPINLIQNVVNLTRSLRNGDQSRLSRHHPTRLDPSPGATFRGTVSFESDPIPEPTNPQQARTAEWLEYSCVVSALVCLGILVLVEWTTAENKALLCVAAALPPLLCWSMMSVAFRLRNTYRFRSHLIAIWLEGNYQHQKGSLHGHHAAEAALIHSDLLVSVSGTCVVTECGSVTTVDGSEKNLDNVRAMNATTRVLRSPRYIVRTEVDEALQSVLNQIAESLKAHRDSHRDVVGVNQQSAGAISITQANAIEDQNRAVNAAQLGLQSQLLLQIAADDLTPEQRLQMLAKVNPQLASAVPPAAPKLPPAPPPPRPAPRVPPPASPLSTGLPPGVEAMLMDAMRGFVDPSRPEAAREQARERTRQIMQTHRLRSEDVKAIRERIEAEFADGK